MRMTLAHGVTVATAAPRVTAIVAVEGCFVEALLGGSRAFVFYPKSIP